MAQSATVERILDAAEMLFAEKGFSETSLRAITGKAGVNLAAVNYHFGSKKALIQAVFARYLTPFAVKLNEELEKYQGTSAEEPPTIEMMLKTVSYTMADIANEYGNGPSVFMRLLGLSYLESQGHLRKFLVDKYGQSFKRVEALLRQVNPELSDVDRFWNWHFMLGTTVFTMAGMNPLRQMSEHSYDQDTPVDEVVKKLIPFLAGGLRGASDAAKAGLSETESVV